ncbi:hypothetical protein JCM10908_003157 [Rhodotorula pacifica]|uniref:mitochondrial 54S ribosomal protein mL43 MRPL51 n=1 Tax=Rhodotorula pacifica TaxID=1495444 RepID=UPI00317EB984
MSAPSRLLRRSLAAPLPSASSSSSTTQPTALPSLRPCRKLVLSYSEQLGSHRGMRDFLGSALVVDLARRNPQVEVVVDRVEGNNKHPILRALYANGRSKEICVRNLPPSAISQKAQLLLDSSGHQISSNLKRPSVQSGNDSVRGVWSAFHEENLGRQA